MADANNTTPPHIAELESSLEVARGRETAAIEYLDEVQAMVKDAEEELATARLGVAGIESQIAAAKAIRKQPDDFTDDAETSYDPVFPSQEEDQTSPPVEQESPNLLNYDIDWSLHSALASSTVRKYGDKTTFCAVDTEKNIVTIKTPRTTGTGSDQSIAYKETAIPISNQEVADCLSHILKVRLNIQAPDSDIKLKALFLDAEDFLKTLLETKFLRLQTGSIREVVDAKFSIDERAAVLKSEPNNHVQRAS